MIYNSLTKIYVSLMMTYTSLAKSLGSAFSWEQEIDSFLLLFLVLVLPLLLVSVSLLFFS